MKLAFVNRFKETTAATSMSTIALGGAVTGFRTLAKAISTGAARSDASAPAIGDTMPIVVEDGAGNWEEGIYTITSATVLTRVSIVDSSNDGAAVTWPAGSKTVGCSPHAQWLAKLLSTDDSLSLASLNAAGVLSGTDKQLITQDGSTLAVATLATLKAYFTNGAAPATDTTAPSVPGSLATSGTTQTQTVLSWAASTDNSGVAPSYEVSRDGTTWTAVAAGTLTYTFTGLTASTAYTLQVRAVDGSGNKSAAASLGVTTSAAVQTGDLTAPSMSGSVTASNLAQTTLTMSYPAGSDNVGVTRYDVSVDTGTANWVANGTNLTYNATGLTPGTAYTLRVRCVDAAGNVSNVLTGTATTSAAASGYTVTGYNNNAPRGTLDLTSATVSGGKKYVNPGVPFTDNTGYFVIKNNGVLLANGTTGVYSGWSRDPDTPPATTLSPSTANTGANNIAAFVQMSVLSAAAQVSAYFWAGPTENGNWYKHFKFPDGTTFCINRGAPLVVSGA